MKNLLLIAIIFILGGIEAQTNFEKGMQKAFDTWTAGDLDEAEHIFERISKVEKNNWLPHYYIAQINSLKSWNLKDESLLKAQLDKAQEHLNAAMALSPDNPELMVLQAHVYTNWIAFDGMTYGMKYSAKVVELYNKAYTLAPENPRVVFSKADWSMGSARYFGQDHKPFCKDIEASIPLFDTFKPESKFHPNWGKNRATEVLVSCKG